MSARNAGHQANPKHQREPICRKELPDGSSAQADDHSPLVRIAPAQLPETQHASAPSGYSGIVIRIGEAEIVLPPEIGMSSVVELVKQLRRPC